MGAAKAFRIDVPQVDLDRIRRRVAEYRWFDAPQGVGWGLGMDEATLRDVQSYWLTSYDWRAAEADLNRYPHFKAEIDGIDIHFVHIVGEAEGKRPLLISHGWPGSFFEFWQVIGPLAYPSQHGGDAADAFDLVIPSLPGYGFSGKPKQLLGQRATARLFNALMRDVLGYDTYLAQGGDWGSLVTGWLGFDHGLAKGGGCKAIHLNMFSMRPTPATPQNEEEIAWMTSVQAGMQAEGSYFMQQATKPQTLAYGLMDSPMGQAAWILEKFHAWSDLSEGGLWDVYSRDQLLTNVMIYLVNDAIASSVWYYAAFFAEGGGQLPEGERCETPTGFAAFPGEDIYAAPPRSWADRTYNLTDWEQMARGGHFAAMEVPDLYTRCVRDWARGRA